MDSDITQSRHAMRSRLLAARLMPGSDEYAAWSARITDHLGRLLRALSPDLIGFYWPHRGEYDPMAVVAPILAGGATAALPAVVARGQALEYRPWRPGVAMISGPLSFGIPHPLGGPALLPDLVLVPLLGFDRNRYRLGYGGGYFDRTLAAGPARPKAVGVGFEIGRVDTIDPLPHDIAMDVIVTELGSF